MNGIVRPDSIGARIGAARGIRVVSLDRDAEVHARLRSILEEDGGFILSGESREWDECELLLDQFVPELLIADLVLVPPGFVQALPSLSFPIAVGLQTRIDSRTTPPYGMLSLPLDSTQVHNVLNHMRCEVCRRKADELSALLQRYMACVARCGQYLATVKVGDGDRAEAIELESILSFSADGNYIRVHTDQRAFGIRETMTGISAKLDPLRFARVHRSFIINLSKIREVVTRDGAATLVVLSNGMKVPVGPNYRDEFSSASGMHSRLIA